MFSKMSFHILRYFLQAISHFKNHGTDGASKECMAYVENLMSIFKKNFSTQKKISVT